MKGDATYLGVIRRVIGAKIFIEICPDIPSANPIIHGRAYRLGQIGSFVRIPLGFLNLYGVVSMVGASETALPEDVDLSPIFASLLCSKKFWAHKINFFEASHLVFNDRFVPSCRIGGT